MADPPVGTVVTGTETEPLTGTGRAASAPTLDSIMDQLRLLYETQDGSPAEYQHEAPTVRSALERILGDLGPKYSLVKPLGRGGAGIVFPVSELR